MLDIDSKISKLQLKDNEIKILIDKFNNKKIKGFIIENGVLLKLRKGRTGRMYKQLVVPTVLREDILKLCHDNFTGAHLGEKKTWTKLSNRFYWHSYYNDTMDYIKSCETCERIKPPPSTRAELKPITDFDKPFDKVAVDILELSTTNTGNRYVVVFSDYLT